MILNVYWVFLTQKTAQNKVEYIEKQSFYQKH